MSMEEMPAAEFMSRRKINPYGEPREHFPGDDIFWTKQQFRIYHEVLKTKANLYVDAHWVDVEHMRKDKNRAYFAEALDLIEQLGLEHIMTF